MTDAEADAQEQRIIALLAKWRDLLWLNQWRIVLKFHRGSIPDKDEATASCHVRWQYLESEIAWNLIEVREMSDGQLEKVFVHECMHIVLNEMRDDKDNIDHEERVATVLALIITGLHAPDQEAA